MQVFCQIDDFLCFLRLFAEKFTKTVKHGILLEKNQSFWPNGQFFVLFHEMRHFLQLFAKKLAKTSKHGSLVEKLQIFGQIDDFSCLLTKWGTFCNFLLKSSPKASRMVVCWKSWKFLAKSTIFRAFSRNEALFAILCWKVHQNSETWWFFRNVASFLPGRRSFVLFHQMRHLLQLSAENFTKSFKHGSFFSNL